MMKWGFALNAVAGTVLVASAIGLSGDDAAGLQLSLDRTLRELEILTGLRERIDRGDRDAIATVVKYTAQPAPDRAEEDQRLDRLRVEVARLEMQRDGLAPLPRSIDPATTAKADKADPKKPSSPTAGLTAFESAGFSADAVRQGEALFRAERFDECITVLQRIPEDSRGQYWLARAFERKGKTDEAIAIYTTLSALKDAGWAGERARADLEFLQWKKSVEPTPAKPKAEPKKP
ncbi:MAG: hypothetical protein JNL28_09215 [Planctomycetes bacterium]|nr:hypothetical protein [Planctomycetota bacterium]